jgi:putative membrane protein
VHGANGANETTVHVSNGAPVTITVAAPPSAPTPLPKAKDTPSRPSSSASNPAIPAINSYGTFNAAQPDALVPSLRHTYSTTSLNSNHSSTPDLLPGEVHNDRRASLSNVQTDLIPFVAFWRSIGWLLKTPYRLAYQRVPTHDHEEGAPSCADCQESSRNPEYVHYSQLLCLRRQRLIIQQDGESGGVQRRWGRDDVGRNGPKHRPRYAGGGENIPLEIVRALSTWFAVLEERGTVPGSSQLASLLTLLSHIVL